MSDQEERKQIGVIAKESGIPIKTIRYYEELGLLESSGRTEGGFRLFTTDVFNRLSFYFPTGLLYLLIHFSFGQRRLGSLFNS